MNDLDDDLIISKIEEMLSRETIYFPSNIQVTMSEEDSQIIITLLDKYLTLKQNCIPIQKIKDKLEELIPKSQQTYEEFKKSNKFDTTLHSRGIYLDAQIILLKELLGGTTNE